MSNARPILPRPGLAGRSAGQTGPLYVLPFQLPVEMQCLIYGIVLTAWELEMDKPGDLTSYTLKTRHAAIRGFNYYQKVEPYYTNFMRMIAELGKDPDFRTYPLASHLTHSWLGDHQS